jgi:hypothetical protein
MTTSDPIATLAHRYADAVVHRDADRWAATWAADASWTLGPGRTVEGRDAIVELWRAAMSNYETVLQNVVNGEYEINGDEGCGRWYIMEHFRRADGGVGILLAWYDDTYTLRDGQWLFASRTLTIKYQGAPDLSGTWR